MASRVQAWLCVMVALMTAIAVGASAAQAPDGVSPGAVDRVTVVEGRCPTFIWGAVPQATAYELIVYRLRPGMQASGTGNLELSPSDEALYARVPGGATAWQPELDHALEPGAAHVWFVRAVLREEVGEVIEAGDWSEARYFSVPAMPSAEQVRHALEVLQRWEAATGEGSPTLSSAAVSDAAAVPVAAPDSGTGPGTGSGASRPTSIPTAIAAIRGSIPDPAGETYGVVGVSSSPDGGGVAAANAAGGPDLVLDGSEDGETDLDLYQWGIDRASAGIETFELINSVGGNFDLFVQGNVNATALIGDGSEITAVDADTLDGIDSAEFATDLEAAGLVALHADSADHDGRYPTESELATAGASALHWDNLTAVPPGFADGVDDNTQYSPGPGLIIEGGQILIDPSAFSTRLSVVDDSDLVGRFTSTAIGSDGLPVISYQQNSALRVAHCNDAACSSAATTVLDGSVGVGQYSSVAIGTDGFPLISYYDNPNHQLKVAHCTDITCSSAEIAILDTVGEVGMWSSIAVGIDGLGIISYFKDTPEDSLNVAHCNDLACSSARIVTLDSGGVGTYTSIAIGTDGRAIISYHDRSLDNLKIAHCDDVPCNSAYIATLDSVGDVGKYTSIAIGADGFPIISYWDETNNALKVTHCSHVACFTSSHATLDNSGFVGMYSSIAIGADGFGIISYFDDSNDALKIADCVAATCSSALTATIDNDGETGWDTSIAIGADGLGVISYCDHTDGDVDLKVAHLGIGVP